MGWLNSFFSPLKKLWFRVNSTQKKKFIYGMFMLKDETKEKIVGESFIYIYIYIYICYSHLYITI
ncbi:unnamed protein product [Brassica oleracea]|uniref:(rape) hypothetical protein n=1 Tax=Brassica napus TaxID=3708 RepID=A0A816L5U8_BRANA|nr:unnamed protein product [Brassica napus]